MPSDIAVQSLKRTPLFEEHQALGAKMVPFCGWEMPVHYTGIVEEHGAVRRAAGLFDVSHMGEFRVTGPDALAFLQHVVPNDLSKLACGQVLYTQFTRPDGGTIDDLLIYALEGGYWLVVNASNIEKDWAWLLSHKPEGVKLEDESDRTAMLALQGPRAEAILAPLFSGPALSGLQSFHWVDGFVGDIHTRVARTGYTGEDGFELFCAPQEARALWRALLAAGSEKGLKPAGLGARDTLRLEAGLPLYGHELTDTTSPVAAGLGWSVKLNKGEFLGREVLASQKAGVLDKKVVGLKLEGRAIAREGYAVLASGREVGIVLSGTFSPTLQAPIATALVETHYLNQPLSVQIRQQAHPASITPMPFYRRSP